ncbi:hypothetical protein K435DRAFT_403574 [Dendrothele bispora CBS 962.96]|uniref:Uncharacterized protein n=1 Tax=Dendrothele bispora (strain CBS 962.96) TaxID=1314807 RepID=A0A4S8L768_DENBC|nr:hypothetical protein K435DRAFT_403574 [Dendrothele bispora CBS 962.96]
MRRNMTALLILTVTMPSKRLPAGIRYIHLVGRLELKLLVPRFLLLSAGLQLQYSLFFLFVELAPNRSTFLPPE